MTLKSGVDMMENPIVDEDVEDMPDVPNSAFDKSISVLSSTRGHLLQMYTRMSKELAKAYDMAYIYEVMFDSKYIPGRVELYGRTSVGKGGEGRREVVELTKYGMMGETRENTKPKRTWTDINTEDE